MGDGNGLIENHVQYEFTDWPFLISEPMNESLVFWRHLSDAQLIEGSYGAGMLSGGTAEDILMGQTSLWLPLPKTGRGGYIEAFAGNGNNYYQVVVPVTSAGNVAINTTGDGGFNFGAALTPLEALSIDTKMDDGLPLSGNVVAFSANGNLYDFGAAVASTENCVVSGTPTIYATATSYSNQVTCSLGFKFQ